MPMSTGTQPGNIDMLYLNNDAWDPLEIFRVTP